MSKHSLCKAAFTGAMFMMLLPAISKLDAQDAGIGTFNDLVGEAIQSPPAPVLQPKLIRTLEGGKAEILEAAPSQNLQPGFEYDYRFNQQKTGDRFGTDINEAHASFMLISGLTKFLVEYFHVWTDASNDETLRKTSQVNGIKASITETIFQNKPQKSQVAKSVVFSLPFFLRSEDLDALSATARRISNIDSYTLNPFFILSVSWPLDEDRYRNLKLSLSPGYRLTFSDKNFTNINLPGVHGWKGNTSLLPRIDYDICNLVSIYGSATWNHYTNFYSSDSSSAPDPNYFSLATGISVKPKIREEKTEAESRRLTLSLSYQYDGFNRDFYQHSITLNATYKF
jgi:hypothetical protein